MIRTFSAIAITLTALFGLRCINLNGGTGEETTNGRVIGYLLTEDGKPASRAVVSLLPGAYNPKVDNSLPVSQSDTTDSAGLYSLHSIGNGVYNIQAVDSAEKNSVLIPDILVEANDTTIIPPYSLSKPGYLRIIIQDSSVKAGSYVYLPGTMLYAPVENDSAVFESVPAGFIPSANFASISEKDPPAVINANFPVATGDTTTLTYFPGWKHSKRLFLNTTNGGIYVTDTVYDFPVLIRLQWNNFNFNLADGTGKDVRFATSAGKKLPFEIEHWEPEIGLAEIWVKVDTIFGNNNTQSIIMLYGNPGLPRESNGAAVFDTANGFMGVWHLNECTGSTVLDATLNRYNGVLSPSAPTSVPGNIYKAKQFNGKFQYITMPNTAKSRLNFPENGNYSISAWVSVDAIMPSRQAIISKGNMQYSLSIRDSFCAFTEFKNMIGWETARSTPSMTFINVPEKEWILFTGIRAGNRQYLYIDDGFCTDTANEFIASMKSRLTGFDVSIGRIDNPETTAHSYFSGLIDEVRIYNVALTGDWVRLCFRNQIWDGTFVKFQ